MLFLFSFIVDMLGTNYPYLIKSCSEEMFRMQILVRNQYAVQGKLIEKNWNGNKVVSLVYVT